MGTIHQLAAVLLAEPEGVGRVLGGIARVH